MADLSPTAREREFLFAAAAIAARPEVDRRTWDQAMSKYLCLKALEKADILFGDYAKAIEASDLAEAKVEYKYGAKWRSIPEAKAEIEPSFAAVAKIEEERYDRFLRPMWNAAAELALTPAPDVSALMFKLSLIDAEKLVDSDGMTRSPMDVIAEDAARLSTGEA